MSDGRRFDGRRVLLTGGASGIGLAAARRLAAEGARLAILDVNAAALAQVAADLGAEAFPVDLADASAIAATVQAVGERLGGLDGVVNCAGVHVSNTLAEFDLQAWNRTLAINLTAPCLVCAAALPNLGAGSAIVNVASGVGLRPDAAGIAAYAASKGGLIALTKAMAAELAPKVRANAVCPGLTNTPMVAPMLSAYDDPAQSPAAARYALGRPARPAEIASAIAYLLSDEASFITGVALAVDGGRTFH